jgi:hypothetical protein
MSNIGILRFRLNRQVVQVDGEDRAAGAANYVEDLISVVTNLVRFRGSSGFLLFFTA